MADDTVAESSSIIRVDPSGDLDLHLEYEDKETKTPMTRTFVVSTKALCLASPVFSAMLDPKGAWASNSTAPEGYHLHDDNPVALSLVLRIAHLQFRDLPKSALSLEQIYNLAVVCDKYDMVKLVRPWLPTWLKGRKPTEKDSNLYFESTGRWLFVAWAFGDEALFTAMINLLIFVLERPSGQLALINGEIFDTYAMPCGLLDAILEIRSKYITALVDVCYNLLDRYEAATPHDSVCTKATGAQECDALIFGSLIKGVQSVGLWPRIPKPYAIKSSITHLERVLRHMMDHFSYPKGTHAGCPFTDQLKVNVKAVGPFPESVDILDPFYKHIDQQCEQ